MVAGVGDVRLDWDDGRMTRKIMIVAHASSLTMQLAMAISQAMIEAADDVEFEIDQGPNGMIIDKMPEDMSNLSIGERIREIHVERHKAPVGHRPRDQYRNKGRRT